MSRRRRSAQSGTQVPSTSLVPSPQTAVQTLLDPVSPVLDGVVGDAVGGTVGAGVVGVPVVGTEVVGVAVVGGVLQA